MFYIIQVGMAYFSTLQAATNYSIVYCRLNLRDCHSNMDLA